MRQLAIGVPIVLLLASATARSEDAVAALGEQRAGASRLQWEIREAAHPVLGDVRFAHTTTPITTAVGISRIYSNVYVSCELGAHRIAIELTNQAAADDPGGLAPARMPRLVCKGPAPNGAGSVQDPIEVDWMVNGLGDAMARGFRPAALRRCAAIGILEEVALPKGWPQRTVPVQFEITPYSKALDSVFATCGEHSAYGPPAATPVATTMATPVATRVPTPIAAPAAEAKPRPGAPEAAWKTARTTTRGRTNVRAEANTRSAIVATLDSGTVILVQRAGGDWYRAKSRSGARFEGFIREDRLVVK